MERIRTLFDKIVPLNDSEWKEFSSRLTRQEFPKKTVLLKVGQTERYLSFVEQGIIRFFIPGEDNDLTFAFAFEDAFMSAYDSFLSQTPSTYQVETLSPTVLWQLTYVGLQVIYNETGVGNIIGRIASEDLFMKKAKRELSLLSESAEQRYLHLLAERQHLFQNIPLKYIASYIGITPQALSRIRRRIS